MKFLGEFLLMALVIFGLCAVLFLLGGGSFTRDCDTPCKAVGFTRGSALSFSGDKKCRCFMEIGE
jgi:hypothetical protein